MYIISILVLYVYQFKITEFQTLHTQGQWFDKYGLSSYMADKRLYINNDRPEHSSHKIWLPVAFTFFTLGQMVYGYIIWWQVYFSTTLYFNFFVFNLKLSASNVRFFLHYHLSALSHSPTSSSQLYCSVHTTSAKFTDFAWTKCF